VDDPVEMFTDCEKFFRNFADPAFPLKPILKPEYEALYADDNRDFAGRYTMRFAPYIFEPTYGDDFVHGHDGPSNVETAEDLKRTVRDNRATLLDQKRSGE